MGTVKVIPRSLTDAYKRREGDFSPNLVGFQFTDGVSLFTFGNFQITTNFDSKINKNFTLGGQWSDYYSLDNLNLTESQSELLMSNDLFIKLNFDINKIDRYVYFGSFHEFARVTIEQIIQKWKGSLYLNPQITNTAVNTVLSFSYDLGTDTSTFLIPKSVIQNPFELITTDNQDFSNLLPSDIFNISRDYNKYVIYNNYGEFNVVGYTGDTTSFPYLRVQTEGNPFPSLSASTFGQLTYHFKPNNTEVELFFTNLSDFESILLNRLTVPIYTSSFSVPQEADGFIVFNQKRLTWPISDGYNLDINTRDYGLYVEEMLNMANLFDQYRTDLVARKFVAESIHEYDTDGGGSEVTGRKANKLLRIYGREFDEVKKYIDGISFANVVTYNKLDNTSDELIKIIAQNLGFDVLLTTGTDNFNLLEQIQPSFETSFSGYSRSLSSKELDIELWRRLVINAWWLFKSKGTRKVIEFFFKLFNIPQCMVSLDEYVYLASNRLDIDKVYDQLITIFELAGLNVDDVRLSNYPIDIDGFPRVLPETNDNYFQMSGFWYNGGNESTVGNNPHIGPYDYGKSYFSQFECFVSDFGSLATGSTTVRVNENHFNNYNEGTFIFDQNGLPVPYYGTGYANTLNTNGSVVNAVVNSAGLTAIGGNNAPKYGVPSGDTYSMKINFTTGLKSVCEPCSYNLIYGEDGIVYIMGDKETPNKPLTDQKCCQNYWLPMATSNSSVVCPKPDQLAITSPDSPFGPCVVLDMSNEKATVSVSQSCCNRQTLGFDVVWDGKNCLDANCIRINGGGIPQQDAVAQEFTGRQNYTIIEMATIGIEPPAEAITYACYWCPPDNSIQVVCSVDEYLNTLTDTQIINIAISLGATQPSLDEATSFIVKVYSRFFDKYGCFILDGDDKPITNNVCCKMKGGVYTTINGSGYCVKPLPNPCDGATILNGNHIWVNSDGSITSSDCCTSLGGIWTDGTVNIASVGTMQDYHATSYVNQFGLKQYCTNCPTEIMFVEDCTTLPCNSIVKEGLSGADLSQQCCTDYGFTWNNNKCYVCPAVVNTSSVYPYTITNLNDSNLTEYCCSEKGGWYGLPQLLNDVGEPYNPGVKKCYQCPPTYYYPIESSTTAVQNTNYSIINGEVLYGGLSLSQTCCNNYNTEVGGVSFDVTSQKCLVDVQQEPTSQEFTLKFGDTSCGTTGSASGTQTRGAWIINPIGSISYASDGVYITVYVPIGQTPLTSPMFMDPNLTSYVSPNLTFNSPNGRWERTFEYNNNVYNLNFGSLSWTFPTPVSPWPTPTLKGQIGLYCSGF